MNREELAWAAGFFDGEGYVGAISANDRSFARATIQIAQAGETVPEVLLRFREAVGVGRIGRRGRPPSPRARPQWEYVTTGYRDTQAVIALLWEWLGSVKRAQAREALLMTRVDGRRRIVVPVEIAG